jgi:hypothetical protein
MSQVFDVTVTDKKGKARRFRAEVGGGTLTAEELQRHYDHHMRHRSKAVQPFPGAQSWKVHPESETVIADRPFDAKTPPDVSGARDPLAPQDVDAVTGARGAE